MAPKLTVVPEDATAEPKKLMSVTEAANSGTQRDLLVAMRDRIARAIDDPKCPPRDLASLTRRQQDIGEKLDALDLRAKQEGEDAANLAEDETWNAEAL